MLHSIHDLKKVLTCVSIFLALQMVAVRGFGQAAPLTPTTTTSISGFNTNVLESITGWAGSTTTTGITSWQLQGSGTSFDYRGTAQASGTSGGFYGSSNISFLGSGNASNANATLRLQNTTGSTITAFRVVYTGKMWKSGTASPAVSVSWSTNSSNAIPGAGALTNSLASLGFSDATTNISSGVQLAQSVSSVSIPNNNYVFLRWIHPGGSNSDNLGWDEIYFIPQPITQASTISFTSVSATGMTVNWTNGNGRRRAVFMKSGSGTITNPSDGTLYTASTTFSSGTQLGTSGYYCIYDGAGTSVAVTGLSASTTYYVQVFEYNSDATPTAITTTYLTSTVSANQTTSSLCSTPTAFGLTGGGSYCPGGSGVAIGVANSQTGVNYQLYRGTSSVGSPVAGTGAALPLGTFSVTGTYTVQATTSTGGCTNGMTGSVSVSQYPVPTAYAVTGSGSYCVGGSGTSIGLAGSQAGVNYQLYSGSTPVGSAVAGTGSSIIFGTYAAGTYTVRATNGTTGCTNAMSGGALVSIDPLPTPSISGSTSIPSGGSAVLTFSGEPGDVVYYWNGATTVFTTVGGDGTSTVTVTPTITTTYSITTATSAAGCSQSISGETATVTVSSLPTAGVSGATDICVGQSTNIVFSGTAGATVYYNIGAGPLSVTLSGASGIGSFTVAVTPTVTTTYTLDSIVSGGYHGSLSGSSVVSVNPLPSAYSVTGTGGYCAGGSGLLVGLSNSENDVDYQLYNGAALVGSPVSGTAAAISFGSLTTAATYTVLATNSLTGCANAMSGDATISINPLPTVFAVTGGGSYCSGGAGVAVGLNNSESGVNYQLFNGTSTVGSPIAGTGAAISFGNQTLVATYTVAATNTTTGCSADMSSSAAVSITSPTNAGTVTGPSTISLGLTGTLNNAVSGGVWSSSNTAVATIGTSTGVASGLSLGTTIISYAVTGTCGTAYATRVVTVTALTPSSISANTWSGMTASSASGASTFSTLPASTTPGSSVINVSQWNRGSGLGVGSATGSYSSNSFTSTNLATAQSGNTFLTFTVTNDASTEVKLTQFFLSTQVSSSGPTNIQLIYKIGSGTEQNFAASQATATTGSPSTNTFTGTACIPPGATATFKLYGWGGASAGTFRVNNNTSITATYVTGVSSISATASSSNSPVCAGSVLNLTGGSGVNGAPAYSYSWAGPSFSSSLQNPSVSSVTTANAGTYTFTVTDQMGCSASNTTAVTVNTVSPTTGTLAVCVGNTTSLFNATSGGTWSSSNISAATIDTSGVVAGVAGGTSIISYQAPSGCYATAVIVTVNTFPVVAATAVLPAICAGSGTSMSATGATSYTWSPATGLSATTGATVTASPAITTTYTVTGTKFGCSTIDTATVTVNPLPTIASITGADNVCVGSVITLTNATTGGIWSSSSSDATVSGGVVTGVTASSSIIIYTVTNGFGCTDFVTTNVTVNALPTIASVTGADNVCAGSAITLTNATTGGIWSSSSSDATVSGGVVTGVTAGSTTITYTITNGSGCTDFVTTNVTVNALPTIASIAGADNVCVGSAITLTNATTGGVWSSSSSDATLSGGVVTGVTAGSSTITYTVTNGSGCTDFVTTNVTVNALPTIASIAGADNVCVGSAITLTNATTGGVWSSSSSDATLSGGVVTGVTAGSSTITYTVTNGSGCTDFVTTNVTVNALPTIASIAGADNVCVGSAITLTNATTGGVWSSSSSDATLSGGVVTGVTAGSSTITYTVTNGSGCTDFVTANITVNALPTIASVTGADNVCAGSAITLTNATTGGIWSSSPSDATVSGGVVTGVTAGSATITYTVTNGFGCTDFVTTNVTVNALPTIASITGADNVCVGSAITLSNATTGGAWSSSSSDVTVSGGVVTGVTAGSATITYTVTNGFGCTDFVTTNVIVNALPTIASITGADNVCVGSAITLSNATTGGTWSSSSSDATVSGGVVTAVTAGSATITYTITNGFGCTDFVTTNVTVNALPVIASITGADNVCAGLAITLTNATTSGLWSSSSSDVTVSGGVVTGVTAGSTTITYTVTNGFGCTDFVTTNVTVNALPVIASITGADNVCVGSAITLSNATTGGVWSSSSSDATVSGGVVTGVTAGSSTITYTLTNGLGCTDFVTTNVTVNALPTIASITGADNVCAGSAITLTNATTGGVWSSSSSDATVSGGVVTGVTAGSSAITYTVTNGSGCTDFVTTNVTVNALPTIASIAGADNVCAGSTITLTNATTGGIWSSSSSDVTVSGGVVTGVTAGSATITYRVTNGFGCTDFVATNVTVNTLPTVAFIAGASNVCVGSAVALSSATSGGTWSSSNFAVLVVDSTGMVTGVTAGSALISYVVHSICGSAETTKSVVVNPLPTVSPISGSSTVCVGSSISLTDATSGGHWATSVPSKASVSTVGVVNGLAAGTAIISYIVESGCTGMATKMITINSLPGAGVITGPSVVLLGSSITLSDTAAGGTWSASNANASVSFTGVVSGLSLGSVNISYSVANGCGAAFNVKNIMVSNLLPIEGLLTVCAGNTTTLTEGVAGGTWSSGNTAKAIVSAAGLVTGVAAGTAVISYIAPGSWISVTVTVNALPAAIVGVAKVCPGTTATLTDVTAGGVWSSSDPGFGTVNTAGVVTGVAAGTANIMYTLTNGCSKSAIATINPNPSEITGTGAICAGATTSLFSATPGLTWSSSDVSKAIVGISSGVVTGVAAGTAKITYKNTTTSCFTTMLIVLNATPSSISGTARACEGLTTTLGSAISGGTWSSVDPAIATIDGTSGVVTGMVGGTTAVVYTIAGGCGKSIVVTVNPNPTIGGSLDVCLGKSTILTSSPVASSWASNNTAVAPVGSGSVAGMTVGTADITVTATTGCKSVVSVTVNALPPAISGTLATCVGSVTTLSNAMPGGTWSSNTPVNASINSSGELTGLVASNVMITYTSAKGCIRTGAVTVNAAPTILGMPALCVGTSGTLIVSTPGIWSSSNTSNVTVGPTGVVTGISAGTATISYTSPIGCTAAAAAVVNITPDAIGGASSVCAGGTLNLSNSVGGGVWSSSASYVTVGASGNVTGAIGATATISYTIGSCRATRVVTILATPAPFNITNASICEGATTSVSSAWPGTWSTITPTITTVSAAGIVTGGIAGNGTIVFTGTNGCQISRVVTVNVCPSRQALTGLGNMELNIQISLFPNPTNGMVTIQTPEAGTVSVLAIDGKEVISYQIKKGETNIDLPKDLAAGVYMCRFKGNEGACAMVRLIYQP